MKLVQFQFVLSEIGRWFTNVLVVICGILLCTIGSIVFYEVCIRYLFNAPTAWTEEVAEFLLVWYGLLAAAVGARRGIHFAMRWGLIGFSPRTRWVIRQVVSVFVIILLINLVSQGYNYLAVVADQTSTGSEINMRLPWAGVPIGLGAILMMYILDFTDGMLSIWTGRYFSEKEAREEEIYRALHGDTAPAETAELP
jgi:TRAP-type C4-dicarboxylate transport system permease small subunit